LAKESREKIKKSAVAAAIVSIREEYDLSLAKFAVLLGVAKNTVHRYEVDLAKPEPKVLRTLLGMTTSDKRIERHAKAFVHELANVSNLSPFGVAVAFVIGERSPKPDQYRAIFARAEELLK